jgi:hypothetical protein
VEVIKKFGIHLKVRVGRLEGNTMPKRRCEKGRFVEEISGKLKEEGWTKRETQKRP